MFFDIWMRLLCRLPVSVLWLLEAPAPMPENLRRQAAVRGVDPSRLIFAPTLPQEQHLARHQLADLFLDVLPYGAHTTASDALWSGLPVLTLPGSTFSGRVAASLLTCLGMTELIAASPQDYEAKALKLARKPAALDALRQKLRTARDHAPLFNGQRFARDMENIYRGIWAARRQTAIRPGKTGGAVNGRQMEKNG